MAITRKVGVFDYDTISKITGKNLKALYQDCTRGNLDLDDLKSVVIYIARNSDPDLKTKILLAMTERELDLSVANKKRKEFMKKRNASREKQPTRKKGKDDQ